MKNREKNKKDITLILYGVFLSVMVLFFVFVDARQSLDIFQKRTFSDCLEIENVEFTEYDDFSAPAGVRQEYRWNVQELVNEGDTLAFYTVHQNIQVTIDGEQIYGLKASEDNLFGRTTACNWVRIPMEQEDAGKEICVKVYPVYRAAVSRRLTFHEGSELELYVEVLKGASVQIILCMIAILCGVLFVLFDLYKKIKHSERTELGYLGLFAILLSVWKITDTYFSPFLFRGHELVLSYVTLGTLMLMPFPLLWFLKLQLKEKGWGVIKVTALLTTLNGMTMLGLQLFHVMDFRESILGTHIGMVVSAAVVLWSLLKRARHETTAMARRTIYQGICLMSAIYVDILIYYLLGNSAVSGCTMLVFVACLILTGIAYGKETMGKAYVDIHTGLYNRNRCNEILKNQDVTLESTAVFMFDINSLKKVNDTHGHSEGDALIFSFANILRRTIPSDAFVGRYGGDEFIAVMKKTSDQKAREVLEKIQESVEAYNEGEEHIKICYAAGYALSEEHPGCTLEEILRYADQKMYQNKQEFYRRDKLDLGKKF